LKKVTNSSIKNNQIIPVDGVLTSDNTSIDYSFVTGEEICSSSGENLAGANSKTGA
jgi:Cu+-exporting ATPase